MLTVSVNLNVPALPDNDIAFANNAAWQNYWSNIELTGTFDPADNALYVDNAYNNALPFVALDIEGLQRNVVSKEQFDSLMLDYQTLKINYKALLNKLKEIGLLENSI